MSKYLDNNELFLEPKTTQYGGHMVMTNVMKPMKKKYINIDTRFRDEYNSGSLVNYNITLPERITEVKSIIITNIEIPNSIYNISSSIGNNAFNIINTDSNTKKNVIIPDGNYNIASLISAIYDQLNSTFSGDIMISSTNNKCIFNIIIKIFS
jgi:di/tripeptidase